MDIEILISNIMDAYEKEGKTGSVNCSDAEIKRCIIEKIEFILSDAEHDWTTDFISGIIYGIFALCYNNLNPNVIKKEVKKEMG